MKKGMDRRQTVTLGESEHIAEHRAAIVATGDNVSFEKAAVDPLLSGQSRDTESCRQIAGRKDPHPRRRQLARCR